MAENHIARLMRERDDARLAIKETRDALIDTILYLQSSKFHGVGCDYVHVSTDMMPKLAAMQFRLCGE
jgi:hypothetical protein